MATIRDVIEVIEEFAPLELQASFDNCGLKIGDVNRPVIGIMVTLDTNEAVVNEAIKKKCNLIIEHHPSIFYPIKSFDYKLPLTKAMTLAIKNDIAVYSAHTNIDFCENGLNDTIARKIGITNISKTSVDGPRFGNIPRQTIGEYASKLSTIFNDKHVKIIGDESKYINSVAVVNGGGGNTEDLIAAITSEAEVYVTGDVKYNVARLAKDLNYAIIEIGHYNTEQDFMPLIGQLLKDKLNYNEIYMATTLLNPYNQ